MKINQTIKWYAIPGTMITAGCIATACSLLAGAPARAETSVFGQSDTIFRMGRSLDNKDLYPVYEYLRFSVVSADKDGSATSLNVGGWARGDLADKTARDRYTDADVQYGFISYQGAKNNLLVNAGRQFVTEGVAAQRLDGLYVRSDFAAGFGAAAYVGSPVVTEPTLKADDFIFGGRVTHSLYKYYTLGVSALKSFDDNSAVYREEEGFDLWVHPLKQVNITGRSAYNSVTNGWMEHAYAVSYAPLDSLRIGADYSYTSYKDYFYRVTTSALTLSTPGLNGNIDEQEKVKTFGGSVDYTPIKNLTLAADFKNYNYDVASAANYFGGKATYSLPDSFAAGFSIHRMDGNTDKLNFLEYRVFASKKISHLDLALDFIDVSYDSRINGVRNVYTVVGAASYEFNQKLKVGADVDYSKNPDFDNEVKGLVKLTYAFDTKRAAEGGSK
ncbi:MAG: hypothetical protein H7Y05_01495 [Steroidobacteraceae bacterium]|nr:hypothetical protein [Deltaproteobacteria bacterium]